MAFHLFLILSTLRLCFSSTDASISVAPRNATRTVGGSIVFRCNYPVDISVDWTFQIGLGDPNYIANDNKSACILDQKTVDGHHTVYREADGVCVLEVKNLTQNLKYACLGRGLSERYIDDKANVVVVDKEPEKPVDNLIIIYVMAGIIVVLFMIIGILCFGNRHHKQPERSNQRDDRNFAQKETKITPSRLCCCSRSVKDETDADTHRARPKKKAKRLSVTSKQTQGTDLVDIKDSPTGSAEISKLEEDKETQETAKQEKTDLLNLPTEELEFLTSKFLKFDKKSIFIQVSNQIATLQKLGEDAVAHILTKGKKEFCPLSKFILQVSNGTDTNDEGLTLLNEETDREKFNDKQKSRELESTKFYSERLINLRYDAMKKETNSNESSNEIKHKTREIVTSLQQQLTDMTLTTISCTEQDAWILVHETLTYDCNCHNQNLNLRKRQRFEELFCDHWLQWHIQFQNFVDKFERTDGGYFNEHRDEMKRIKNEYIEMGEKSCKKCKSIPNSEWRGSIDLRDKNQIAAQIVRPHNVESDNEKTKSGEGAEVYKNSEEKASMTGKFFNEGKDGPSDDQTDGTDSKLKMEEQVVRYEVKRGSVDVVDRESFDTEIHCHSMTKSESSVYSSEEFKSTQETNESCQLESFPEE